MKSPFLFLAMSISVFGISAGRAQETIDVANITCDQFLTAQVFDSQTFAIWLNGYYHGVRHNTVVDLRAQKKNSLDVIDYCISHKQMKLMDAVENALGVKK